MTRTLRREDTSYFSLYIKMAQPSIAMGEDLLCDPDPCLTDILFSSTHARPSTRSRPCNRGHESGHLPPGPCGHTVFGQFWAAHCFVLTAKLLVLKWHLTGRNGVTMYPGGGGYSGFQETGMIEQSKKSRPKKIPRVSSKTQKNPGPKINPPKIPYLTHAM